MRDFDMTDINQVRVGLKQAKQALDGLQWKHDGWCEINYPIPFSCDCRIMVAQDKVHTFRMAYNYLTRG